MMRGEIPGNTCEKVDIAFAYSLGKFYCFAITYVKFGYRWFLRNVRHNSETDRRQKYLEIFLIRANSETFRVSSFTENAKLGGSTD
jgi:hypothetical protein